MFTKFIVFIVPRLEASAGNNEFEDWKIAVIVVCCVVFVALVIVIALIVNKVRRGKAASSKSLPIKKQQPPVSGKIGLPPVANTGNSKLPIHLATSGPQQTPVQQSQQTTGFANYQPNKSHPANTNHGYVTTTDSNKTSAPLYMAPPQA